jgi:capsular exopolysaccharide family
MNRNAIIKKEQSNQDFDLITFTDPSCVASENYRRIKVSLEFTNLDMKKQVLEVTSASQGEAKTTTLLNLAYTYVEDNKKVLVIDMDFRRPRIHHCFKVPNKNGLSDYLAGTISKEKVIQHSNKYNMDFIVRGSEVPYPTSLLSSKMLETFIKDLRKDYDYIFIDCPPVLLISDTVVISRLTDGTIFVVSQVISTKDSAKDAVKYLKENNVNILGCVFTNVNEKSSNYNKNYRYKYYNHYSYYNEKPNIKDDKKVD